MPGNETKPKLKALARPPEPTPMPPATPTPQPGISPERYVGNYLQDRNQARFQDMRIGGPRSAASPVLAGQLEGSGARGNPALEQAKMNIMLMGLAAGYPRDLLARDLGREEDRLAYRAKYGLNPDEPRSKAYDYGE